MNKENEIEQPVVSEPVVDTGSEAQVSEQTERQVPLSALEAERQKRQEREQENLYLRELAMQQKAQLEATQPKARTQDDSEDLVNKRDLEQFKDRLSKEDFAQMKRDITEDAFKDANPEAIKQINMHLKEILDRKPWLASAIESAPNRYSRAYEIVKDYAQASPAKQNKADDAKRIVENSKKPGSPATVGKPANMSQGDYVKSLRGTKEFKEYRRQLQGK